MFGLQVSRQAEPPQRVRQAELPQRVRQAEPPQRVRQAEPPQRVRQAEPPQRGNYLTPGTTDLQQKHEAAVSIINLIYFLFPKIEVIY